MLLDARTLKAGAVLSADVCIAGTGPAGMTLATQLIDSGLDVIVLESGGLEFDADNQALNDGATTGIKTLKPVDWRVRVFGGTSAHWEGFCRPLGPEEFARRDWIPGSGWPIDYDTLEPFYVRAQDTLQVGALDYDAKHMSERIGIPLLSDDDRIVEHRFYRLSPPTRFGMRFRDAIKNAENLTTYLNATLIDIVLDDKHGSVERFDCSTLDGKRFSVEAGRFVIALGGLENPRILLASNKQIEGGVGNSSGKVGRTFIEHPHYYRSAAVVWPSGTDLRWFQARTVTLDDEDGARLGVLGTIGLRPEVRAAEGLLNMSLGLAVVKVDDPAQDTGAISPVNASALLGQRGADGAMVRVTCRTEQSPFEESTVTLTDDRDALGVRKLNLHWAVRDDDKRALRRALEIVGSELGRLGLGRLWTPRKGDSFDWNTQPGGHHMGTTRMGDDAKNSVLDANLRCHDVKNLYVAGSSVFVTVGDANPTLTIVALAHRLADHLRGMS
jgi:choline dehydrogenase-like flavoprotein